MFEEEEDYKGKKINISIWKRIFKVVATHKAKLITLLIASVVLGLLDVSSQQLNRWALQDFVGNNSLGIFFNTKNQLNILASINLVGAMNIGTQFYIFLAINAIFPFVFGVTVFTFIQKAGEIEAFTSYELRKQSFEKLQRLSFSYYDKTHHGWLMARMTSDSKKLSNILSWGLIDIVWTISLTIFILIMLFITEWRLALLFLAVVPIMAAISLFINKMVLKHNRVARKFNSKSTAKYNESFMGAKTTKSLNIEDKNIKEYEAIATNLRKSSTRAIMTSSLFVVSILSFGYLVVGIIYVLGGQMVVKGLAPYLSIYLFITYTISLFDPMMQLSRSIASIQEAGASAERIVGLIETKPELIDSNEVIEKYGDLLDDKTESWEDIDGDIEFKNVTFYYKPEEVILDNFNLKIKKGQTIALVGHTGSGKTTIVNLISRFYEPVSGQILIDGKDYKERSIHWLHKRLGYVLQSPQLFSTSIIENIRYGNLGASDEECIEAAKAIGAHEFIDKLSDGYQTMVGEGGSMLSVGQKQLISFARAVLANPRILVLDEATSSIDSEAEKTIQDATTKILGGRTNIVVAHRLSTIVNSDLIIHMEHGKINEMGTHSELISLRGAYFELYKNQFMQEKEEEYINS